MTWQAIRAGAAYFGIVFVLAFALGVVRTLVTAPWLGEWPALLIEAPILLFAAWRICGWVVARFAVPPAWSLRLLMGGVAFALLMAAELALSVLLFGRTPAQHFASYAQPLAQAGLAAQMLFALLPIWVSRQRAGER